MRIGINATCYNDRPSGAKQRFLGLYGQIFRRMNNHEFIIFQPSDCNLESWFHGDNIKYVKTPIPSEGRLFKALKGINYWKSTLNKYQLDIFECFNIPTIQNPNGRTFQTIHDIRSLAFESSKLKRNFSKLVHSQSIKKVDRIITVSNYMKNEIQRYFPCSDIRKIYNGIDLSMAVLSQDIDIKKRKTQLKLPSDFLLSIGHFEKRKNYSSLLDAIKLLKDKGRDLSLIIVGNDNGEKKYIADKLKNLNLEKNVILFSNLTNEDVLLMYSLCTAFIFPSTYEGFGIPILEAMANAKPFILSDIDVFKEIAKSQGNYFNPHKIESIASSIIKTIDDSQLCMELSNFGKIRVVDFDFKNIAIELQTAFQE